MIKPSCPAWATRRCDPRERRRFRGRDQEPVGTLGQRIKRENTELYALLDKLG